MVDDRSSLERFLDRINGLKKNQFLNDVELDFAIFWFNPELNSFVERVNRRLKKPLRIWSWRSDEEIKDYEVSSNDIKFSVLSQSKGWNLVQGVVNPDNLNGKDFLRLGALYNVIPGTEARLYASPYCSIYSI